jgi:cell division protein FtsB
MWPIENETPAAPSTIRARSQQYGLPVCVESQFPQKTVIRLAPTKKLQYADWVVGGVFPPHPLSVAPVAIQILAMEGWRMTRKSTLASLVVAVVLSLSLTACKDTKTLQDNERLKAQVADLQKQNGEMGNNLETVTAARDALVQENEALKAQIRVLKPKGPKKKVSSRKRRRG